VIGDVARTPNLCVGGPSRRRTASRDAHRCIVAQAGLIRRLRGAIAPFSVNVFAAAALEAALADRGHVERYVSQVRASREMLYDACARLGSPSGGAWPTSCWSGWATRLLSARPSPRAASTCATGRRTGVRRCVRITAGWVADTEACVAALEEVLCAGRR